MIKSLAQIYLFIYLFVAFWGWGVFSVVVLVFTGEGRLLFTSSFLAANKSLRIFNITKMAAKRLQCAMLNRQYWVFNLDTRLDLIALNRLETKMFYLSHSHFALLSKLYFSGNITKYQTSGSCLTEEHNIAFFCLMYREISLLFIYSPCKKIHS